MRSAVLILWVILTDPLNEAPGELVKEMHAVPRQEVEARLHQTRARLLDVRPARRCGPAWASFRYDATRQEPA